MSKRKILASVVSFLIVSLFLGVGFAHYVGSTLPETVTITQSKSFVASQELIWTTLMDIENYPLWKPSVKSIEMLGTNDKGFTMWREVNSSGESVRYEITDYIPNELIEVHEILRSELTQGVWVYKLSSYEDSGVLNIRRLANIERYIDRFIHRWIDTKYNEVDYQLMRLNVYLKQLMEDQEEVLQMTGVDPSIKNNEAVIPSLSQ
ncbi:MAG: SRPBCC family protein [Candidatus Marinamargulisbacteria bacterium]